MANSYFKFKQFTIHQDKCAMKVCTDACLFGALVSDSSFFLTANKTAFTCLDIGTGTGLLSLMVAQKNYAVKIDAVEIDADASKQAAENITASLWADNIQVFNEDIVTFGATGKKYDCIFSNPPFFEDHLQSPDIAKNNAKHDTSLNLAALLQVADNCLNPDGFFAVLLPYHRIEIFIDASKNCGLHLIKQLLVKQTLKHKFFRGILFFNRKESEPKREEIIIKNADYNYTPQFSAALKDYYLFL